MCCRRFVAEAAKPLVRLHAGNTASAITGAITGMTVMVVDAASNGMDSFVDKGGIVPRSAILSAGIGLAGWAAGSAPVAIGGAVAALTPIGFTILTKIVAPKKGK